VSEDLIDEMITFVREQLDEDERIAREATPGPWAADDDQEVYSEVDDGPLNEPSVANCYRNPRTGDRGANPQHIARHDPARVLREVEAKRKILDELLSLPHYMWQNHDDYGCPKVLDAESWRYVYGTAEQVCDCGRDAHVDRSLRLLAAIFSDRPGYREEWRP
jgi:hypothetical protein